MTIQIKNYETSLEPSKDAVDTESVQECLGLLANQDCLRGTRRQKPQLHMHAPLYEEVLQGESRPLIGYKCCNLILPST